MLRSYSIYREVGVESNLNLNSSSSKDLSKILFVSNLVKLYPMLSLYYIQVIDFLKKKNFFFSIKP